MLCMGHSSRRVDHYNADWSTVRPLGAGGEGGMVVVRTRVGWQGLASPGLVLEQYLSYMLQMTRIVKAEVVSLKMFY